MSKNVGKNSLILIVFPTLLYVKTLLQNFLKIRKTLDINEIPDSCHTSLTISCKKSSSTAGEFEKLGF